MKIEVNACDKCGGVPDGDRIDNLSFFHPCGHAVCNNCDHRLRKEKPQVKWPVCPLCEKGRWGA